MPTLRLTLFDDQFEVLDRVDVPVAGKPKQGAGEATKAGKQHFWSNHFSADMDTLMASRQNLMERLTELVKKVEALGCLYPTAAPGNRQVQDLLAHIRNIDLSEAKAALMEGRIMNDLSLPKTYVEKLEQQFGRRTNE